MEKGLSAAVHTKEKKKRGNDVEEDKISRLPDEVLVSILSLLTIDEAGSTSVLSRRWRKVWTFIPSLIWDASETIRYLRNNYGIAPLMIDEEREIYVSWVNQVLESYQGSSIDEFRVIFDLNGAQRGDIDKWVNFAFEKKVRRLVMDFRRYNDTRQITNVYPFPQLQHSPNMGIPSLIVLELVDVNISQRAIEYFISTCPYLEQLTIHGSNSQDLVDLEVAGQSLCLKYLKIMRCLHLKSVYLSASNLSSFAYDGEIIEISFANVPNLVEVAVGGAYFHYIIGNFPKLSNFVVRLETLKLRFSRPERTSLDFTLLTHLKILNLDVLASDDESLLFLAPLIKAAPSLYRIVLLLHWAGASAMRRRVQSGPKSPHQCLKEVEIVSFVGRKIDMEFASYLIEDAINLEKIIIDPHQPYLIGWLLGDKDLKQIQTRKKSAMEGAMALKSKYSLGDKLVLRNFESSV